MGCVYILQKKLVKVHAYYLILLIRFCFKTRHWDFLFIHGQTAVTAVSFQKTGNFMLSVKFLKK